MNSTREMNSIREVCRYEMKKRCVVSITYDIQHCLYTEVRISTRVIFIDRTLEMVGTSDMYRLQEFDSSFQCFCHKIPNCLVACKRWNSKSKGTRTSTRTSQTCATSSGFNLKSNGAFHLKRLNYNCVGPSS